LAPSNYRTNADLEDLGYLPPRRSAFNRFNRTLTQVRIPEKATTLSGACRPRDPVDDDQGGARA
jgi:hypothetical protein